MLKIIFIKKNMFEKTLGGYGGEQNSTVEKKLL